MIFMRLLIIEFISFLRMALMVSALMAGFSSKLGGDYSLLRLISITFLSTLTRGKGCLSSKQERFRLVLILKVGSGMTCSAYCSLRRFMKSSQEFYLFNYAFIICSTMRSFINISNSHSFPYISCCLFLSFSQFSVMNSDRKGENGYLSCFIASSTCLAECLPLSTDHSSLCPTLPDFLWIFGNLTTSFSSFYASCLSFTIVLLQIDHGVIYCPRICNLLVQPNIFYYEALIQSSFIMGCIFSKDKRAEKHVQDPSKAGTKEHKVGASNQDNIPRMQEEYQTEEGMKPSPRPELPSPFKDTQIDPQKIESSKRLVEKSSEAQYNSLVVNDETNIVNNQRFTSGINILNLKIQIDG